MFSKYTKNILSFSAVFYVFFAVSVSALPSEFERVRENNNIIKPTILKRPKISEQYKFAIWLADFKEKALAKNIMQQTIENVLDKVELHERAIKKDRAQPEKRKRTFAKYKKKVLSRIRINKGKKLLKKHQVILEKIGKEYGVQPRFIVALWGIETNYGKTMGDYYIPTALASLAYEGRRREFFEKELINILTLVQDGSIVSDNLQGSWAGAMGQSQFMPSAFIDYAVDYNGDGRKDIWGTKEDVFASIANFLKNKGWQYDTTWGREILLPKNFDIKLNGKTKLMSQWRILDLRKKNGKSLPRREINAKLIVHDDDPNHAYLVYRNFDSIMLWNRSRYFATAVGHLSDKIKY